MARIITILALALRGNLAKLQPILFLDASQVHLHAVVRKQSLNSNPSFFLAILVATEKTDNRAGRTPGNSSSPPRSGRIF
jgi:hypothetical protein